MDSIKDIVKAWATSFNPTDEQKELADLRYNICLNCDQRKTTLGVERCNACGCPLSKKIFTQAKETCPLNKWLELDKSFTKQQIKKRKYKLI